MKNPVESVILEEDIDENYEPTDAEIDEYAQWLGMSFPDDNDLLWIAREGLKAPLPEHWKPCKTSDEDIYYFNFQTGESVWDHPCDEYYKKLFEEEKTKKARKTRDGHAAPSDKRQAAAKAKPGAPLFMSSQPLSKLRPLGSASGTSAADEALLSPRNEELQLVKANDEKHKSSSGKEQAEAERAQEQKTRELERAHAAALREIQEKHRAELDSLRLKLAAELKAEAAEQRAKKEKALAAEEAEHEREIREKVAKARKEAEASCSKEMAKVREEVEGLAAREKERLLREAEEEKSLALRTANEDKQRVIRAANEEVQLLNNVAQEERARITRRAQEERLAASKEAEHEAAKLRRQAELEHAKIVLEAEEEKARVIRTAQETKRKILRLAEEEEQQMMVDAEAERQKILRTATEQAEGLLTQAQAEAEALRKAAAKDAAEARAKGEEEASATRDQMRTGLEGERAQLHQQAEEERARLLREAEEERNKLLGEAAEEKAQLLAAAAAEKEAMLLKAAKEREEAVAAARAEADKAVQEAEQERTRLAKEAAAARDRVLKEAEHEKAKLLEEAEKEAAALRAAASAGNGATLSKIASEMTGNRAALASLGAKVEAELRTEREDALLSLRREIEAETARELKDLSEEQLSASISRFEAKVDSMVPSMVAQAEAAIAAERVAAAAARRREMEAQVLAEEESFRQALHESSTERREAFVREVAAAEAEAAAAAAARIAAASTTLAASAMPRGAPSQAEAMVAPPAEREVPRPAPSAQVEELPSHACSVLGELSNSQAQTHAAADKRPELSKVHSSEREVRHDAERAKLKQIRAFLNSQARYIKSRQQQLLETQQEWKRDMRALVAIEMPPEQAAGLHEIMRKVRVMLERQSSRLNEDTEQVQASFRWLRAQEAQRKQARKADNDDAFISSDDSYLSLPRPVDLKAFQIPAATAAPSFDGLAALSRPAHMEMEFREELRSISEELKNLIGTIVKPIGVSDPMLGANPKLTRAPLPTRDVGSWAQQREKVQLLMQLHSRWLRSFRSELAPPLPSAVGKNVSRQAWA